MQQPKLFKIPNIDQYINRPNALFGGGKNHASDESCYTEFSKYYTFNNKLDQSSSEYQAGEI